MSTEKTAEYFRDKSEEQIINWMIQNLEVEQIKSCLGADAPQQIKKIETKDITINDLRRFCSNKRYVIEEINNGKVFFWYYTPKSNRWVYGNAVISDFPTVMGQTGTEECGEDTIVKDDFAYELKQSYQEQTNTDFIKTREIYKSEGINTNWEDDLAGGELPELEEVAEVAEVAEVVSNPKEDMIIAAIRIQRNIEIPDKLKTAFSYAPILIEGVLNDKIYYYYFEAGKFKGASLRVEKLEGDFKEIVDDIEKSGIEPEELKAMIKIAATKLEESEEKDVNNIKRIYNAYPLNKDTQLFTSNLFTASNFGKLADFNYVDLDKMIKRKYGSAFLKRYKPQKITNKNGVRTVVYVKR